MLRPWVFPLFLPLGGLVAGCGGASAPQPPRPGFAATAIEFPLAPPALTTGPGRWMPASAEEGVTVQTLADGTRRMLLGRLRVEVTVEGRLRRATTLLDGTPPAVLPLPPQMGGGFLFVAGVANRKGTHLWRAPTYLGAPIPFATTPLASGSEWHALLGPDRIVLHNAGGDRIAGLDGKTGALLPPPPLPVAPRFGTLTYADERRALATVDLVGTVITRDGGRTWHPPEPGLDEDLFGREPRRRARADDDDRPPERHRVAPGPFGSSPLRAAVEDGYPLTDGTALLLRAGRLGRVRLTDGDLVELFPESLLVEENARCQTIPYGTGLGFVCGGPNHGTSIYRISLQKKILPVTLFARPRMVTPAANGTLVVRGGCGQDDAAGDDSAQALAPWAFCVLDGRGGAPREVRFRRTDPGDSSPHVAALTDGRVVALVPPKSGGSGQLTIVAPRGQGPSPLAVRPLHGAGANTRLGRGRWLNGWEQTRSHEISGWVETNGAIVGVRVGIDDGQVTAGPPSPEGDVVLVGSRALTSFAGGRAWESLDYGQTWQPVDVPTPLRGGTANERSCGPTGCVITVEKETWLRVGWGPDELNLNAYDFNEPPVTDVAPSAHQTPAPLNFRCEPRPVEHVGHVASAAPLPAAVVRKPPVVSRRQPPSPSVAIPVGVEAPHNGGPWLPLAGVAAPTVPPGYVGFDAGSLAPSPLARLYAWTPRGTSTPGAARCQGRFVDGFALTAAVRSTAVSPCPWPDEPTLLGSLGFTGSPVMMSALTDPGGNGSLLAGCRSPRCELFGLLPGQALTRLPDAEEVPYKNLTPALASMVRTDDAWFVALSEATTVTVWRIDSLRGHVLARFPRIPPAPTEPVRIVRRARSGAIGLFLSGLGTMGVSDRDLYVLPVHPETGVAGSMLRLGPADLSGPALSSCNPTEDGWLIEMTPPLSPILHFPNGDRASDVHLRVRWESQAEGPPESRRCLDGVRASDATGHPFVATCHSD